MPDYIKKARKLERRKEYLRAAEYYVLGGEHERAIELFVKENLYLKAAKISERLGKSNQAAEYYGKIGDYSHAGDLLKEAGDTFQAALMFKRAHRYRDAAEMFDRSGVISESARMFEMEKSYRMAAERYLKAGMFRSAAICFERAADLESPLQHAFGVAKAEDSDYRKVLYLAAESWAKVPDILKAAGIFEKLGEWERAGRYYEKSGEAEKALKCYDQSGKLELSIGLMKKLNQHERAAKLMAQQSGKAGDPLKAAQIADQQKDYATAAEFYEEAGEFGFAAERYEKISDYLLAAEMYFKAGNLRKAAQMYEMAGNYETAAKLYDDLGIVKTAIKLHVKNKNYPRAARLYLDQKENEEALRLLLRVPEDHPSKETVRRLMAICYFRLGKTDAGREQAKEVFKRPISEDNIEVYYEYACALYEESKISEALIAFQDIVKFDKNYRESRQYLNWLAAIREEIAASAGDTVVGELPLGLVINNRYELLQLIGKGGMGIVYRAADRELNITVALKILRPKYSYDPDFIEMIKREVTLARMLTHPNILKIYDLGRAGNLWFISMEFLEGKELKKVIKEHGHLPIDMIKKTLQQVLSGLEHSHQHNLVHSDIKPHNIFIDDKGNATIVDFGISRAAGFISPDATITGTPEYISPEQIQGDAVTAQSDLYSLGITLYEMATGEMPFSGPDIDTILELQLEMVPPSPNELRADIPSWLNRIIMKLLVKDSRNRYQSAAEVQRDIPVI